MLAFIRAAEHGSFSAAARASQLTPSAVSKLISRLEERLQVRLFVRSSRALLLTEEGAVYLKSAWAVVDAMGEADSLAERLPTRVSGMLRVHTMTTFAKHQILPWLPHFLESYPLLDLDIQLGAQYLDLFDQGIDVAIHSGFLPSSSRVARRLNDNEWIICASPHYLANHAPLFHPQDLLAHQCFGFDFESQWSGWSFQENGRLFKVPFRSRSSFGQGDLLRDLALQGAGIVKLAGFHIGEDIRHGRLVPLLSEFYTGEKESVSLIYANRKYLSPRIKVFIDFLSGRVKDQRWTIT